MNVPIRTGVTDAERFPESIVTAVLIFGIVESVPVCGALPPAESKKSTRPLLTPLAPAGPVAPVAPTPVAPV